MWYELRSWPTSCPLLPWCKSKPGTCPGWSLGSTLLCVRLQKQRTKGQSLEAAEGLLLKSLRDKKQNKTKPEKPKQNKQKTPPVHWKKSSQKAFLSTSLHSSMQYTFCKCILTTSMLILPCAHSGLYLTSHNRLYSAFGTIKQIGFVLFSCACH